MGEFIPHLLFGLVILSVGFYGGKFYERRKVEKARR